METIHQSWKEINDRLGLQTIIQNLPTDSLPPVNIRFKAFELPLEEVKVVILGQDPYHDGSADGLCFSSSKINPSLKNIFKCLIAKGHMTKEPATGSLMGWKEQGVLLLNVGLTVLPGKAKSHLKIWRKYTNGLIVELSQRPIVFCLFGNESIKKAKWISAPAIHYDWCHPSPLNRANNIPATSFVNCDVFCKVNAYLAANNKDIIKWGNTSSQAQIVIEPAKLATVPQKSIKTDLTQPTPDIIITTSAIQDTKHYPKLSLTIPDDTIYAACDGGATANGKANCRASYGSIVIYGNQQWVESGLVPEVVILGKEFKTSNNRGELLAMIKTLETIDRILDTVTHGRPVRTNIVYDSEYAMKCITIWYPGWVKAGNLNNRMNIDMIAIGYGLWKTVYDKLMAKKGTLEFKKIKSHKATITIDERLNDYVDKLCQAELE